MRVIAGIARRTELKVASGSAARPFLEKARGALFNSIGDAIVEARVLDVYAGSGSMGIEALSRGAQKAVFIEMDRNSASVITDNLKRCKLDDKGTVITGRAERVLAGLSDEFDFIFADPPFPVAKDWETDKECVAV
ncbi:MAG: RsmD family RNA methyltransferase, partial [Planctomycetes bacterium]|nr:RsmD family RNA methyltransferase [Planctomycetota bacterium]